MFDIGLPEFMVLALVAVFIFGPDKLPDVARQAGRMLRQVRQMAKSAQSQIADELGPEFKDINLRDLNPRAFVQKHLFEDDDEAPTRPGHRPLEKGEQPPYDADAT